MYNETNFLLAYFVIMVRSLNKRFDSKNIWLKATEFSEPISLYQLINCTEKDGIAFMKAIMLVHGVKGETMLNQIFYREISSTLTKQFLNTDLELVFDTEIDRQKYIAFYNSLLDK